VSARRTHACGKHHRGVREIAKEWIATAKHPTTGKLYKDDRKAGVPGAPDRDHSDRHLLEPDATMLEHASANNARRLG